MKDLDKVVELMPREWSSERPRPREPIFGSGAEGALFYVVGWMITASLVYWVTH